jgi:putative membrane protein
MQTSNTRIHRIIYALAFVAPLTVWAQNPAGPSGTATSPPASGMSRDSTGTGTGELSSHDRKFVKEAAIGGMFEVEAGQLALKNASSDEVKQMAQHIVDDHSQANEKLKSIAQTKGVTDLPTQLDSKHQKELDKLSKLSSGDFDRKYSSMMVSDHKKDIKAFEKEAKSGSDPDIKQFAADAVPTLKGHLSMAQNAKRAASGHTGTHTSALDNGDASQSTEQRNNRDSTVHGKNTQVDPLETGK